MDEESPNLATLRDVAEHASKPDSPAAWAAYHAKRQAEEARRDKLRALWCDAARALAARVGRLPGIIVEAAEADDFQRAELRLSLDGKTLWTRPIGLSSSRAYCSACAPAMRSKGSERCGECGGLAGNPGREGCQRPMAHGRG